jgi:hypothetical protein
MPDKIPRRPIRGLIVDVDGTLTTGARKLHFGIAKTLSDLDRDGLPVIMATGNVLPISLALHRFLGFHAPIIAENGGLVYFNEDKVVHLASREVALRAYEELRKHVDVRRLFTDRWRETEVALEPNHSVEELLPFIEKLGVKVENTGFAIHLFEPTAGKLPAAKIALESLGLGVEDCLVAGDGDNDVELLKSASVGVSFPAALPSAKNAADFVTKSSDGDGLLEALEHFGIIKNGRS